MAIEAGALVPVRLPVPTLLPGEVLIRVAYAGVNRADLLQVAGHYDPPLGASPLPGLEVSGTVVAQADEAGAWMPGQTVAALLAGGGYAEYVAVPATQLLALPPGVALREAASLPEAAATSMMALGEEGRLQAGERVLIHGGTSGVGLLMVQIARGLGAEVVTTVGSEEKRQFLAMRGIVAVNHRAAPFGEQVLAATGGAGVDVIIDTLGGPALPQHLRLLRPGGRLVSLAMLEGSALPEGTKMTRLLLHSLRWSGATLRNRTLREKAALLAQVQQQVWPQLAAGTIQPVIDTVFPLTEAKKAHARMQERLHLGKILLEVPASGFRVSGM